MPTVNDVYENLPADQLWCFGINSSSTHVALSIVVGIIRRTHAGDTRTALGLPAPLTSCLVSGSNADSLNANPTNRTPRFLRPKMSR